MARKSVLKEFLNMDVNVFANKNPIEMIHYSRIKEAPKNRSIKNNLQHQILMFK